MAIIIAVLGIIAITAVVVAIVLYRAYRRVEKALRIERECSNVISFIGEMNEF